MKDYLKEFSQPSGSFKEVSLNKSKGILDDFSVRHSVKTRELDVTSPVSILKIFHDAAYLLKLALPFTGAIVDIPSDWHLCDGTTQNGKVLKDLRNRFVVGAGDTYAVDATGGEATHLLTISELPEMGDGVYNRLITKIVTISANRSTSLPSSSTITWVGATEITPGNTAHENRPPYYALAWIEPI